MKFLSLNQFPNLAFQESFSSSVSSAKGRRGNSLSFEQAWTLWTESRPMEPIADALWDFCSPSEVQRCIHVGLLCVQQRPEDRSNMLSVILMLGSETVLPEPKQPGFFTWRNLTENESSSSNGKSSSANECSITLLEAR